MNRPDSGVALEADAGGCVHLAEAPARHLTGRVERRRRVAGDQVDHAADRVRSVERRRGALDDFHLLEPIHRLAIEIDHAALDAAAAEQRLAVHQHQHLARIDTLNLLAAGAGGFGSAARQHARHFAQQLRHRLRSALFHEASRQHRHVGVEAFAQFFLAGRRNDLHGLDHRRRRQATAPSAFRRARARSLAATAKPGAITSTRYSPRIDWRQGKAAVAATVYQAFESG